MTKETRADRIGAHRTQLDSNRKRIFASQTVCGICGAPVDFTLKYPHPLSATLDHIIPVNRGGHPSELSNLQLAHFTCNRQKSDKLIPTETFNDAPEIISNRILPPSIDWAKVSNGEA